MPFEEPKSAEGVERETHEEAHFEANMLRTKLRELIDREPTAEDYDKALQAVEETKRFAEEEPEFDKILYRLLRIGNKYFNDAADGLLWLVTLGNRPNHLDQISREDSLKMFDDAAARLEELRAKAGVRS